MPLIPRSLQPSGPTNRFQEYREMLRGERPLSFGSVRTGGGGAGDMGGGVPPGDQNPSAPEPSGGAVVQGPQAPSPVIETPTPTPAGPGRYSAGAAEASQGLLQPLSQQAARTGAQTQEMSSEFYRSAGTPAQPFNVSGAGLLSKALTPGASSETRDQAKQLVNMEYKGPTGLDTTKLAAAQQEAANAYNQSRAIQTGAGVTGTLKEGIPGLSQGEAAFEGQALMSSPQYRQAAQAAQWTVGRAVGALENERRAAEEAATLRTERAKGVSEAARAYLGSERSAVESQIQSSITAEKEKQAALEEAYSRFMETGDISILDKALQSQYSNDPNVKAIANAQQVSEQLKREYSDIEDIPLLQLTSTSHGREAYTAPGGGGKFEGWVDRMIQMHGERYARALARRVVERQQKYESYFSPGSAESSKGTYSSIAPLYYSETGAALGDTELPFFEGGDLRNYAELDMGQAPSLENMSTDDQRYVLNTINELLDDVTRLEASGEPYRAAAIALDLDKFLSDQESAIAARGKQLKAKGTEWIKQVQRIRKKYRQAQQGAMWAQIAAGVGGALTFGAATAGLGGLAAGTGFATGKATGLL